MFNVRQFGLLFSLFRERFDQKLAELNALDSAVGDGDHGFTMARTMRAAETASRAEFPDLGAGFDAVADAMAENAGGAIGPLMAALFAEGGIVFADKKEAGLEEFYSFLKGGLQAVQDVGNAQPGDKTLVDALSPAVKVLSENKYKSLAEGIKAAAEAARIGTEETRQMAAAQGRASFAADRSIGHQDAGATSLTILLRTFHDFFIGARASAAGEEENGIYSPPPGKLINHPDDMIREDNQGLAYLYQDLVRLTPDNILVRAQQKEPGKVALVIGHGGGHTPSMGGFVGPGLLDADVYGPVYTCASGISIARAIHAGERGGGVVLLVSNHSGDVLNARLAVRRTRQDGIQIEPVILGDDIATAPREKIQDRRGLGGLLFALKIGGGAAEAGKSLSEVAELMRKTNLRTATLSVAVKPPTHPATGELLFELPPGQIEIGTGVHGEVGVYRGAHLSANEIIDMLLDRLLDDLKLYHPDSVLIFINGAGGTSKMELHILYRRAYQQLGARGIEVAAGVADSYFTTQEMGGFSLSLCAVDQELLTYWKMPASGPSFHWPYQ
ncbi:MAG: DAK2 domain-containing protein [Anaerolineales bacterium]|nr:MAG: DAK2 domain-containing protein [Anaerolineales bacterium]